MKILIVEDDALLRQGLQRALGGEHYSCDAAASLGEARQLLAVGDYALLILDLGLPDGEGLTALSGWRRAGFTRPVLILTARDALEARIAGLDSGADDYLIKPFALAELLARVRALIRRDHGVSVNQLACGDLLLDLEQKSAHLAGQPLQLTRREFALLRRLVMQAGQTVARERLLEDLYDWQDEIGSNALEVHIHHLRRKLGAERIRTVRGEGYRLESP